MIGLIIAAFASPILVGIAAKLIAGIWLDGPVRGVAGFAAAVGFAVGKYSYYGPPNADAVGQGLASLLALFVLWFVLLRPQAK